jgi:hypothetical protein
MSEIAKYWIDGPAQPERSYHLKDPVIDILGR